MKKKIVNFLLSLEDEIEIKNYKIAKKYIFIGSLTLVIYFIILIININFSKNLIFSEKRNPEYQKIETQNDKNFYGTKSFIEEKNLEDNSYEKNLQSILNISNEEIKKIFKEQNLNISDEEIEKFRKEFLKNMPKNQKQIDEKIKNAKILEKQTLDVVWKKAKEMSK